MKHFKEYSLLHHNTFGIDQKCDEFVCYESVDDAVAIARGVSVPLSEGLPILILGGGSNLLLTDDFRGRVLTADKRFEVEVTRRDEDRNAVWLRCWSGTTFDEVVAYAVEHGYYGLENLSLIPGECGASAVQNIGAYGVEAKDVIAGIEAVEMDTGRKMTISAEECRYGYRHSRFKDEWKDRYLITYVTYRLSLEFAPKLDYGNIRKVMEERGVVADGLTGQMLRDIIIGIRREKLPDPKDLGNAGSFFMNPIVDEQTLMRLKERFPDMKYFKVASSVQDAVDGSRDATSEEVRYKIPAGWMIEQCGWKGRRLGSAGVYEKQALVLVNHGQATGADVVRLMEAVRHDVFKRFGIHIYPEVNIR